MRRSDLKDKGLIPNRCLNPYCNANLNINFNIFQDTDGCVYCNKCGYFIGAFDFLSFNSYTFDDNIRK